MPLASLLYRKVTGLSARIASLACSIGLISFLNRREELAVPNWPTISISTGIAAFTVVTPRMLPIKQLSLTFAPEVPIAITLLAVVTPRPAPNPKAMLLTPVLLASASKPVAVFWKPVVLFRSAPSPLAVLKTPVVLL